MRKIVIAALAALSISLGAKAQDDHEPKTSWPYLYAEFSSGTYTDKVGREQEGRFNVNVINGRLHYISGETINEALPGEAFAVQIGQDCFVNQRLRMMQVLAKNDNGLVVLDREVDYVALNSTGGAYGSSSSTLGTRALSSVEGIAGASYIGMNHMELRAAKAGGQTIPLIEKLYIVAGGRVVYATKKDVTENTADAAALKQFFKECKVKWKDPQSLLQVVDFLASNK